VEDGMRSGNFIQEMLTFVLLSDHNARMSDPSFPISTSIERRLLAVTLVFLTLAVSWHFWH